MNLDNTEYLVPFQLSTTQGNFALAVNADFRYNPFSSTLIASQFTGNAATATSATTATSADTATTATNANNANITASDIDETAYITFVSANTGNNAVRVDGDLTYNAFTNTLILSKLILTGLPTSATGLVAGSVWNNLGVLNIVL